MYVYLNLYVLLNIALSLVLVMLKVIKTQNLTLRDFDLVSGEMGTELKSYRATWQL